MTTRSDELLQIFEEYDASAAKKLKTDGPKKKSLWEEDFEVKWPAMPVNAVGAKRVSDLLECKPNKLPGPDFEMPMFDREQSWPEYVQVHIPSPDEADIEHYVMPIEAAYWVCYALRVNKPFFCSGVKGCGKSTLPKRICALLNWPFIRKQSAKDLDSSEFFGQWKAEEGNTVFVPGDLPQAAVMGAVFLIDEISNLPPELHPALHQVAEKGGRIYLNSQAGDVETKIVELAETFRLGASDNTRGQGDSRGHYSGTDVMNSATMDRFRVMVVMDYMDRKLEKKVLKNTVPGVTDLLADKMLNVAARVRAAYSAGDLSDTLSMRPLIEWAEKAILTHDIMGSLTMTMLNKIESESERKEIESYVQASFGGLLNEK